MSISMLAAALTGPKVAARFGPRTVVQVGLAAMAIAALVLVGTIDVTLNGTAFAVSLVFFGIGAGLLMSQLGNVIMSSAPPDETNRSEEHTSELQSQSNLVCRLLLEQAS